MSRRERFTPEQEHCMLALLQKGSSHVGLYYGTGTRRTVNALVRRGMIRYDRGIGVERIHLTERGGEYAVKMREKRDREVSA